MLSLCAVKGELMHQFQYSSACVAIKKLDKLHITEVITTGFMTPDIFQKAANDVWLLAQPRSALVHRLDRGSIVVNEHCFSRLASGGGGGGCTAAFAASKGLDCAARGV